MRISDWSSDVCSSDLYGPISARVTGTTTSPQVLLRAPRPGVGVGLVDLEARVRGANGAYAVVATGGTNYGPFSADVLVRPGNALTVDVNKLLKSEEHTSELQSLMRISYAGFCMKKK